MCLSISTATVNLGGPAHVAEPAGDHLYIPLPYGMHVDGCDNVLGGPIR